MASADGRAFPKQLGLLMAAWRERIQSALIITPPSAQGLHLDPLEHAPPNPEEWPEDRKSAWLGREMDLFRDCVRIGRLDVRESVLDDLSKYYCLSPEECRFRCLHWEEWSVREWRQGDRSTREGLQAFYDSLQSWSFDLLWYAYLQSCGYGFPSSVMAAGFALHHCARGTHLDLGSGVGVTVQLFSRLGFTSTLADVSKSLLDFACWRLARHGDHAEPFLLTSASLSSDAYDIVTAMDTLVHVPDFDATVRDLHRVIRPSGWLITNFDVRKPGSEESASHLNHNAIMLQHRLERVGFVWRANLGGMLDCYQRVDPNDISSRVRTLLDKALLPFKLLADFCGRVRWPTPRRVVRVIARKLGKGRNG
jgi:SAM-dependent methyltransferase